MPVYDVPAQDELEAGIDREPLPGGEDYLAEILEITEATKPDFDGNIINQLTVKFSIESFADGEALQDVKRQPVTEPRWAWKDFDPKRVGFQQNGTPSLWRQMAAAINGVDVTERMTGVDTELAVGKKVVLSLVVKANKKGVLKNNIVAIKSASRRRGAAAPSPRVAQETVSPEYARAVADLVSGDTASDAEVAATSAKLSGDLPF